MKVAFRADASLQIGTGHVMRCLTLADALNEQGASCHFLCREHEGNLTGFIRSKGHTTHVLSATPITGTDSCDKTVSKLPHRHWLGASQEQDALDCAPILAAIRPDWLVVDHYALDAQWERELEPYYRRLMVIDDLADRQHDCDLLLDQTFGRSAEEYSQLVPDRCRILCGSRYALLRPEFAALRPYSLSRRSQPSLRNLLITMGGVDKDNVTFTILDALHHCPLPADCRITVVMGAEAPWQEQVRLLAQAMPWPTRVLAGVNDMASLMADSDLAIGAAGATSWERCCLGLPSLTAILAPNQLLGAMALGAVNAARLIEIDDNMPTCLRDALLESQQPESLAAMSSAARKITDGQGASSLAKALLDDAP